MKRIVKHCTYIAIEDYTLGECPRLESAFTYMENWKTYPVGFIYVEEEKELRIFGGAKVSYIQYITGGLPYYENFHYDEPAPLSMHLQNPPRSILQEKMIKFLIGEGEYQNNKNLHQLSCNAETGEGKTFCAVAMMTYYKERTVIIVNRTNIAENWRKEISKFTDMDDRNILIIHSAKLIYKITEDEDEEKEAKKHSIFIIVHRTLNNVGEKYGWNVVTEFFSLMGFGLKIYDEAHREFSNTTSVDCFTYTRRTVYLTATLKLNNPKANYIFQHLFAEIPKFNQRELGFTDAKKHIVMLEFKYNSHPDMDAQRKCYNARMHYFSAIAYSKYQVEEDPIFFDFLDSILKSMTIAKKLRTLILVSKIESCEVVANFIKQYHSSLKTGTYHSKVSAEEKERVMNDCDVIVSTCKSLGEAMTIPNLRFVMNMEAHRNLGDQASGRLRRLGDGILCYYGELVDVGFKSIASQWKARKKHYLEIFKDVYEISFGR